MAVPPLIELSHSAPDLWRWFINLTWVRFITRRSVPEVSGPEELGTPDTEFIEWQNNEKKGTANSRTSFAADQPRLGVIQQADDSNGVSEHGQS